MVGPKLLVVASALTIAPSVASARGPCYEVTIIQGPPDDSGYPPSIHPTALNERGDIAGIYAPGIYWRGFWWDGNDLIPLEQPAGFPETIPLDISDAR
jgi:hypothetical protein